MSSQNSAVQGYLTLAARIVLVLLFFVSSFGIITNFSGTAEFYASVGIPFATLAAVIVLLVKVLGSLMVATGIHARTGAWALAIFTVLATLVAHTAPGEIVNALKNLAIVGGLLLIAVNGAGAMSLEHKVRLWGRTSPEHTEINTPEHSEV